MRSLKPRTVQAPRRYPWHMQVSGILDQDGFESRKLTVSSFAEKVIKAAKGESGIIEPTYVYLPGIEGGDEIKTATGCDYFSVPVELGVCPEILKCRLPLTTINIDVRCQESNQCCSQCQ